MMLIRIVAIALGTSCLPVQAQYADLTVRFVHKLPVPQVQPVGAIAGVPLTSEKLRVNPINAGIRDVVMYPVSARRDQPLDTSRFDPTVKPANPKPLLEARGFQFVPHVLVLQTGQALTLGNTSVTLDFRNNTAVNVQIPAGGRHSITIDRAEPSLVTATNGAHSWMSAVLVVQDHPYVGVSDADGRLDLTGLAPGKTSMKIMHEVGNFKQLTIRGQITPVQRGVFEVELNEGPNDLGTIELSSTELKP